MLRMCFQTVGSSVVLCYPVAQVRMLRLFVLGLCGDVGLSGGGWPVVVRNMFVIKSSHCAGVEVHRPMHTASPDAHSKTDAHSRPTHSRTDTQQTDTQQTEPESVLLMGSCSLLKVGRGGGEFVSSSPTCAANGLRSSR
jgi:hypothetical protein